MEGAQATEGGRPASQSMIYGQREIKHTRAAAVAAAHAAVRRGHISPTSELNWGRKGGRGKAAALCTMYNLMVPLPPYRDETRRIGRRPPSVCLSDIKGAAGKATFCCSPPSALPSFRFSPCSNRPTNVGLDLEDGAGEQEKESHSIGNTREEAGNVGPMCNIGSRRRRRGNCRESRTNGGSLSLSGSLLKEKGISLVLGCWSREGGALVPRTYPSGTISSGWPFLPSLLLSPCAHGTGNEGWNAEGSARPLLRFMVPSCTTAVLIHLQCIPVADITLAGEATSRRTLPTVPKVLLP